MSDGAEMCIAMADNELYDNMGNPDWEDDQEKQILDRARNELKRKENHELDLTRNKRNNQLPF